MNKNTVKLFFLSLALGGSFLTWAQTDKEREVIARTYDLEKSKAMELEFAKESELNKREALRLAEIYGWPLTIKNDSVSKELQGVIHGKPLYYTTSNNNSAITARVTPIRQGGGMGLNLHGQGMIVGVFDQGIPRITHYAFGSRLTIKDNSTQGMMNNHPTHVAGTIASSGATTTTGNINILGRGLAYESRIWASNWNDDTTKMTSQAGQGLLVSNHSYGIDAENNLPLYMFGAYTNNSRNFDRIAFNHKFYQPVVAAGNDRNIYLSIHPTKGGNDLLTGTATSKNAVVVAAVNEVLNYTGPSSVQMSGFSNYGPTDDFRIKPDISAKGVGVFSSTSAGNNTYGGSNGTSMAAPAVSAVLILWQQHYKNLYSTDPDFPSYMRSATLRGLVAHTADEAGFADGPDHRFGWGLINAQKGVRVITGVQNQSTLIEELTLNHGQTYSINVNATGTEPLIATISWTDREGVINTGGPNSEDLSTPVLVNDLDLRVRKDTDTYLPWTLNKNFNDLYALRADNNVDNIEKVEIGSVSESLPTSGKYTITVSHKGILTGGNQEYTLIVSGINGVLSVEKIEEQGFAVWPNPVTDIVNLDFTFDYVDAELKIYDLQGREVYQTHLNQKDNRLNISNLTSGMYVVKVIQNGIETSKKIIKK